MSTAGMWTSKLGTKYPMALMQQNDGASQKELKRLRNLKGNSTCADCGRQDNSWSSVSHGVICVTCSDVHRSVGTHITKVKGCTGTYLWGPDELERMQTIGNRNAEEIYGTEKVDPSASKDQKQKYVVEKYEKRSFAVKSAKAFSEQDVLSRTVEERGLRKSQQAVEKERVCVARSPFNECSQAKHSTRPVACKLDVPDSFFDDFFNEVEDNSHGKPPNQSETRVVQPQLRVSTSDNLDAFLDGCSVRT